jgi:uncharacterized membrane protein YsdA (DUF1294 family)
VPETVLLTPVFLGACLGGPLGSLFFHHKTRKAGFQALMWAGVAVSLVWMVVYFVYLA